MRFHMNPWLLAAILVIILIAAGACIVTAIIGDLLDQYEQIIASEEN